MPAVAGARENVPKSSSTDGRPSARCRRADHRRRVAGLAAVAGGADLVAAGRRRRRGPAAPADPVALISSTGARPDAEEPAPANGDHGGAAAARRALAPLQPHHAAVRVDGGRHAVALPSRTRLGGRPIRLQVAVGSSKRIGAHVPPPVAGAELVEPALAKLLLLRGGQLVLTEARSAWPAPRRRSARTVQPPAPASALPGSVIS